jgi:DNA topoisomerase-1
MPTAQKPLVIVESPAKAKTLARFLGPGYRVEASYGHIRDLPESAREVPKGVEKDIGRLGVDVARDFAPIYVVPSDKRQRVTHLRAAVKEASELLLATDPDREGESISWHLLEVLRPPKSLPVWRIVFHEVTEEALREALASKERINAPLVRAQEARRILDRLFGYGVSPVLWKKVQTGLSAGRVQSVAVRLIVEREEARRRFRASAYWDLEARLRADDRAFAATLARVDGARVATGKDFSPDTGALETDGVRLLGGDEARALADALGRALPWRVSGVEERPVTQRPYAPFTTSTLQQEANRKLGYSSGRTMQIAQRLFQGVDIGGGEMEGLITYHRTDSTTLSEKALRESARFIRDVFGPEYHAGPRQYQTRVHNAQEAHEAIRPTDFRLTPQELEARGVLETDELRLYELIWKRTIASQMADARLLRTTLELTAQPPGGPECVFTATGKAIRFAGFLRAYVEGSDDPAAELGDQESLLPSCEVGERVGAPGASRVSLADVAPKGHETVPPARYTEASLVKRLEEDGIGRPSTYAPTIETIQRRGYVFHQGKALVPSFTAFAVTSLLRDHFSDYVDLGFTARMEDLLDAISNGELDHVQFLRDFYFGGGDEGPGLKNKVESGGDISYPAIDVGTDPRSGQPIVVRIGRSGPFLQRGDGDDRHTASLPDDLAPADLAVERAVALLDARAAGPRQLGPDPATGQPVFLMTGRYGPYVQLGETPARVTKANRPPRASLPAGVTEANLTLAVALKLLALPRVLGPHPDDGEPVVTNFGRFGPYVKHGSEFRSLEGDDHVFTISLDDAVALLRQPKRARRRQAGARAVLRELGAHPESGVAVRLMEGRYGPYVTDGTTNASVPKGSDPSAVTLDAAVALLRERASAGPRRRVTRRRAAGTGGATRRRRTASSRA